MILFRNIELMQIKMFMDISDTKLKMITKVVILMIFISKVIHNSIDTFRPPN